MDLLTGNGQHGDYQLVGAQAHAFDTTVKVVCKACNNGWMSRLERQAQPALRAWMMDRTYHPSPAEALILLRWTAKTAAMFEFNDPKSRVLDPSCLQALAKESTLPGDWYVGCGWMVEEDRFRLTHYGARLDLVFDSGEQRAVRVHQTLLSVDRLTFMVRYCSESDLGLAKPTPDTVPRELLELWPGRGEGPLPDLTETDWHIMAYAPTLIGP